MQEPFLLEGIQQKQKLKQGDNNSGTQNQAGRDVKNNSGTIIEAHGTMIHAHGTATFNRADHDVIVTNNNSAV